MVVYIRANFISKSKMKRGTTQRLGRTKDNKSVHVNVKDKFAGRPHASVYFQSVKSLVCRCCFFVCIHIKRLFVVQDCRGVTFSRQELGQARPIQCTQVGAANPYIARFPIDVRLFNQLGIVLVNEISYVATTSSTRHVFHQHVNLCDGS